MGVIFKATWRRRSQFGVQSANRTDLRKAHTRAMDLIPLAFLLIPVRCRKCRNRFFNWRWEKIESEDGKGDETQLPPG